MIGYNFFIALGFYILGCIIGYFSHDKIKAFYEGKTKNV